MNLAPTQRLPAAQFSKHSYAYPHPLPVSPRTDPAFATPVRTAPSSPMAMPAPPRMGDDWRPSKGRCNRELFRNMPARLAVALTQEAAAGSQFHIPAEPDTGGKAFVSWGMGSLDRVIGGLAAPSKNSGTLTARTAATNIVTSFSRLGLAAYIDGPRTRQIRR